MPATEPSVSPVTTRRRLTAAIAAGVVTCATLTTITPGQAATAAAVAAAATSDAATNDTARNATNARRGLTAPPSQGATVVAGAVLTAGQIPLTWSYPQPVTLTSQRLEIASATPGMARDGETLAFSAGVRATTIDGLTPNRGYRFRVRGVNGDGLGPWGPWVNTNSRSVAPAQPLNVTALMTPDAPTTATLAWRYSPGSADLTSQRISIDGPAGSKRDGATVTIPATATEWDITGLDRDVVYRFAVRGVNTFATGPWSATVAAGPPARPTDVFFARDILNQETVTWTYPDNAPATTSWRVKITDGDTNTTYVVPGRRTTFDVPDTLPVTSGAYAQVRAVNALTVSNWSTNAPLTDYEAPAGVTGLACTPGNRTATCTWNPVTSTTDAPVQDYTVWLDGKRVDETVDETTTLTGLVNGRNYDITVAAAGPGGQGPLAPVAPVTPRTVPGPVDDLTVANTTLDRFTVTWTPPIDDGGADVENYTVTVDGPGAANVTVTNTTATIANVEAATSYIVTVTAANAAGAGAAASIANVTLPHAPATINATIDNETATVTWSLVPGLVSGYNVYRCQATGSDGCTPDQLVAQTDQSSFIDSDLEHGRWYRYAVGAYTAGGTGPRSDTVSVETTPGNLPAPPTATYGNDAVTLTWPAADGADDGYRIRRCAGEDCNDWTVVANTPDTEWTDTTVDAGETYRWSVAAVNPSGDGAFSDVTYTTPASAPTGVTVTAIDASFVTLTWQPPNDPVAAVNYTVAACSGTDCTPTTVDTGINATVWTYSPAAAGTAYTFTVSAYNGSAAGTGKASTPVTAVTDPVAPGDITLDRDVTALTASWTTQPFATGYQIAWCAGANTCTPGPAQNVAPGAGGQSGTTRYTIDGLAPASEYTVFVRSLAGATASTWTSASTVTLDLPTPTGVTATGGDRRVTVGFTQVPQADSYLLYLCQGASCDPAGTTGTTLARPSGDQVTYTFTGLASATTYRFAVRAVDVGVTSALSATVAATTDVPPPPPTPTPGSVQPVWTSSTNTSASFTWTAAAYATWYTCNGQNVGSQQNCTLTAGGDSKITAAVQACNSSGCSTATTVNAWTNPNTPNAPTIAEPTTSCITASWTGNAASGRYQLRVDGAGTTKTTAVAGTSGTICGLTADTAYQVSVAAENQGNSAYLSPWSVSSSVYTDPNAPTAVTFTFAGQNGIGGDRCITLTWAGSVADNRYRVAVNGTPRTTVTGATSTSVCGLTWNTTATFTVTALNRGNSAWAGPAGAAPGSLPATPAVPTGATGATRDATENVTGATTAVRGFSSSGATSYQVQRSDSPAPWEIASAPFNDSGLTWNTTYSYKVAACSTWGCSPYSGNVTAVSSPGPALWDAARNSDTTKIDVNVINGSGAKGYRIRYCNRDAAPGCDPYSGQAVAWKTANGTTTLTGLDRRSKYAIGVISSNTGDGQGAVTYSVLRYVTTG